MANAWSTVWVLEITRENGKSLALYATYEGARQALADYCYDHWNDREETAGYLRPEDDRGGLIGLYFHHLWNIESYKLEGMTVHP